MQKPGAEYDAWLVDIGEGEQFGSDFVGLNPNSKIPVLLDRSVEPECPVFESCAILHYLARKFGELLPEHDTAYAECLSWLFWQESSASFLGGALLAGEQRLVSGRWVRPLLSLCAPPNGVPN